MQSVGTINVAGYGSSRLSSWYALLFLMFRYGDVYVVIPWADVPLTMMDNGFQLHGGNGRVSLASKDVDIGSDPNMYWQVHVMY